MPHRRASPTGGTFRSAAIQCEVGPGLQNPACVGINETAAFTVNANNVTLCLIVVHPARQAVHQAGCPFRGAFVQKELNNQKCIVEPGQNFASIFRRKGMNNSSTWQVLGMKNGESRDKIGCFRRLCEEIVKKAWRNGKIVVPLHPQFVRAACGRQ